MSAGQNVPFETTVNTYSRQDVLRILHVQPRQMAAWEKAELIPLRAAEGGYSFDDLSRMRALRDLQGSVELGANAQRGAQRMSAQRIRASVDAMQKVAGMSDPLVEASMVRRGSRLAFRCGGALMDPMTLQLAFDFETGPARQLRVVRGAAGKDATAAVQEMFLRAVRLEEDPAKRDEATALYEEILRVQPCHAAACINLGTIYYTRRDFGAAETMYRRATAADPEYALAFFDLGNVLDELQRLDEAIEAYARAVALVPGYADAHYNLALAYERKGERRRSLRHWMTYVRLDPVGPWSTHAKGQAKKILSSEKLALVGRDGGEAVLAV